MDLNIRRKLTWARGLTRGKRKLSVTPLRCLDRRLVHRPYKGEPYRILYTFDPRRAAILLLGGKKTGDDRWYKSFVPLADKLYDEHLAQLEKEGLL